LIMLALRFEKTGSLDFLALKDVPKPIPGPGEVLVQIKAAAINPSDIKNVLGKMHETTVPRTPGRDFAGVVVEGSKELLGKPVFGSGGYLGFKRDGSHAGFVVVPEKGVVAMPKGLSFDQAAAIGLPYITAWTALVSAAQLQAGESVLIVGTDGAVGSAAARIAHNRKARVIGTARNASKIAAASRLPVDVWINLETTDLPTGTRNPTGGKGANVVFDLVGGAMFEKCLASLALRGRQVAISSGPDPRVSFNLVDFYHNESRLFGVDSVKLSIEAAADILRQLTPGFESGEFPPPVVQAFQLAESVEIYRGINEGRIKGKAVLNP
jgi:NADPH2:quinone reductase